jgi:hypothetical protein
MCKTKKGLVLNVGMAFYVLNSNDYTRGHMDFFRSHTLEAKEIYFK